MSRVRRTLAKVRASTPAVRSIVFSMRLKAAGARQVVAERHRKQAADLIHAALRVRRLFPLRKVAAMHHNGSRVSSTSSVCCSKSRQSVVCVCPAQFEVHGISPPETRRVTNSAFPLNG